VELLAQLEMQRFRNNQNVAVKIIERLQAQEGLDIQEAIPNSTVRLASAIKKKLKPNSLGDLFYELERHVAAAKLGIVSRNTLFFSFFPL